MPRTPYSNRFFSNEADPASRAAAAIAPLIVELLRPATVVDVGCGAGHWVAALVDRGIDAIGVDGVYVPRSSLRMAEDRFVARDLTEMLDLGKRFDVALCLEVGEHLAERHAATLVHSLVELAPVVVFSAAIPLQGGEHHVNEQWQDWWRERFAVHGYEPVDALRPRLWNDSSVAPYYIQNAVIYAGPDASADVRSLGPETMLAGTSTLDVVHPAFYLAKVDPDRSSASAILRAAPRVVARAVARRLRRRS